MQRVYVDDTNKTTIICPKCRLEKNMDVSNFKDSHKRLKAKCRCGEVFRVTLEFRKHHRKKVRLPGEYFVRGKDEKRKMIIEDISAGGIRFACIDPHYISRNDTVELKFILDDSTRTEIHTTIEIKWIIDRNVGGRFLNPKLFEKELGRYLQT